MQVRRVGYSVGVDRSRSSAARCWLQCLGSTCLPLLVTPGEAAPHGLQAGSIGAQFINDGAGAEGKIPVPA